MKLLFFLGTVGVLALSSCVDPMMTGSTGPRGNSGSYAKLPPGHRGSAYYHQGRYYTGGQYQTGRYSHQGRVYTSRYLHQGSYYYGGQHQSQPNWNNRDFQHGDFPAGNYTDGNYQGVSWNEH